MTKDQERVKLVLQRMIKLVEEDSDNAERLQFVLNNMLDDIAANDFFGTEGQCDPRGDFRDGEWTMNHVQGIDNDET